MVKATLVETASSGVSLIIGPGRIRFSTQRAIQSNKNKLPPELKTIINAAEALATTFVVKHQNTQNNPFFLYFDPIE